MSSHDNLSLFLMEQEAQRQDDRKELDHYIKLIELKEYNKYIYKK